MSSWSKNRKLMYASVVVIVLAAIIFIPAFFFFYKAPTCFDGAMNGNEAGIDCGGSCQRLCQNLFRSPNVVWTRFEPVAPGLYNVAAYIVNPNPDGEALRVPYHFILYDARGIIITDTSGTVTLPPHRNTLAFQGAVSVGKRIPAKALFEFLQAPDWHKRSDPLSRLEIGDRQYAEDEAGSSLQVLLTNGSAAPIDRISVYAILYDNEKNAIGFSKTVIDGIAPGESALAPFTWPMSRNGAVISEDVLPVAE